MAQFARPDADTAILNWTGDPTDSTGDRFENIDEVVRADGDFVRSEDDPSSSDTTFRLSDVDDPVSSVDHVVRYAYRKGESGGGQPADIDLIVTLKDGLTTIASQTHLDIGTTFVAGSFTLSGAEADNIGNDYNALFVVLNADKSAGARTSWAEVSWLEFEVPNVAGGGVSIPIAAYHHYHHNQDG